VGGPVGARVRLPGGLAVERARDALWVTAPGSPLEPVALAVPGETRVPAIGRLEVRRVAPAPVAASSPWVESFDEAGVAGRLVVRPWRSGERFVPFGGARAVRVSRVLAAAAIPASARRRWPLLVVEGAAGETVLWVIGVRRAAVAPITVDSTHVLEVRMSPDPIVRPREVVT
jgi:tRNA(Ile)-lysidine synthetase-like protein